MNVKAVIGNVLKQGPVQTGRLYMKRRKKRLEERRKLRLEERTIKMLAKGSFEKAKPVFEEWLQAISKKPVTEKYFNKMQRSVYIKRVYPQVYQKEAQKPVQNKIIFMECKCQALFYIVR